MGGERILNRESSASAAIGVEPNPKANQKERSPTAPGRMKSVEQNHRAAGNRHGGSGAASTEDLHLSAAHGCAAALPLMVDEGTRHYGTAALRFCDVEKELKHSSPLADG